MPIRGGGGDVEFGVRITANSAEFVGGVKDADKALDDLTKRYVDNTQKTNEAGKAQESLAASVFKGVGAVEILRRSWDEMVNLYHEVRDATLQNQQAQAALEATVRATGEAAGLSAEKVSELADGLAKVTRFDDTGLKRAATTLLTFTEIGGSAFERILQLSADLASTGRGDLEQWTTVLAKAATAPADSIGALERAIGKLSPQMKVAIQNAVDFNNQGLAQQLVLDEVAKRVGGVAVDAYKGLERQLVGTEKAWTKLKETVGAEIFSAKTTEISVFEAALTHMTETFKSRVQAMKDFFEGLGDVADFILVAFGFKDPPTPKSMTPQIADARREMDKMIGIRDAAASVGGDTTEYDQKIRAIGAYIAALEHQVITENLAKKAEKERKEGEGGGGAAPANDLITTRQKNQLYAQTLQLEESYLDAVYKNVANELEREQALVEFNHKMGLTNEETYLRQIGAIRERSAQDNLEKLQSQLALEKEQRGLAAAELSRARGAVNSPSQSSEIVAAQAHLADVDNRIRTITLQIEDAQKGVKKAVDDTGHSVEVWGKGLHDHLVNISRDQEDYERGLQKQIADMQLEVDLIGKDEIATKQANLEHKLRVDLDQKRLEIMRKIDDLEQHGGDKKEIDRLKTEYEELGKVTEQAIAKGKDLIVQGFNQQQFADVSKSISDALFGGGKDAIPKIRDALENAFKKPFKLAFDSFINNAMSGLFKMLGFDPASIAQNPMLGAVAGFGSLIGSSGASLLGAGQRGQQVGGIVGMLLGGLPGAIAGYFTDPHGPANRTASFGTNPAGQYQNAGTGHSPFGSFGFFDDHWFSDKDMGAQLQAFLRDEARYETTIAGHLSPAERARASASLSGSRSYSFGIEGGSIENLGTITRDRMSSIVDAVMPGLGKLVEAFKGTTDDLLKFVDALFSLRDDLKGLDKDIAAISADAVDSVKIQVHDLDEAVLKAKDNLSSALETNDPVQILASERDLRAAIINRYQTEIQMVRDLEQKIRQIDQAAYDFSINIAGRINSVGGSRDVGGIALTHAGTLQGNIMNGVGTLDDRVQDVQGYVGAIDTWYQSRRSAIEHDMQQQMAAAQAQAAAIQAAAQARISQLQAELQLANQMKALADQAGQALKDLQLSGSNPMAIQGRVGLAGQDVRTLFAHWQAATGVDRVNYATQLLSAIQTYKGLGQDAFQRPSPEWQAIYNEIATDLTEVQKDATSWAQKAVEIQAEILHVQENAAGVQAQLAGAMAGANSQLDALNTEALGYYTWAEQNGAALYAAQRADARAQLVAITGGMDTNLFIAQQQAEAVKELRALNKNISDWLTAQANGTTPPPPTTTTNTDPTGNPIGRGPQVFIFNNPTKFMSELEKNAPEAARIIKRTGAFA